MLEFFRPNLILTVVPLQTFALPDSTIPLRYQALWRVVHAAQQRALATAQNGTVTAFVDRAARKVIQQSGYGEFFTHRLGHGMNTPQLNIGLPHLSDIRHRPRNP